MPVLNPSRVRVVVFRDEKGVKQPVFDSQQVNTDKGEVRVEGGGKRGWWGEMKVRSV